MEKYLELKKELEEYVASIKESIEEMKMEISELQAMNQQEDDGSFTSNYQSMERAFEIAKTRVSISEMMSVVQELEDLLKAYQD